jgi:hypothetical protein
MSPPDSSADDSTRIGPYRTLRELGRGGQAIVWLAEDSRIGRQVALKVMPPLGPGGEDAMRRFRREAEVAARLEHPAICGVLEADLDRGTPYIAMRYVAGETLAKRISAARESNSDVPDAAALRELALFVEKCARALHSAHEAGIIHRDIKPANLMRTPEGEPVILDFGLAREEDGVGHTLSASGEVSGTPAYMSPEQMTGRARTDRRSDVWSLGIVLYEMATFAHPFASATREGLFQAILSTDVPDPRRVNPAIDRDFATILETATAKERDRRYQTALDFAEDLGHWLANEPIRARPAGRFERVARWVQRKPALAASLGAIFVLVGAASGLLAYGVGASGRVQVEARLRDVAEKARITADSERARAEAARAALEQVRSDQKLSDDVDELSMLMGTLWFGFQDVKAVPALRPKFVAAFRDFGADLEHDVQGSIDRLMALRARDPDLWSAVEGALRNLAWLVADPSTADAEASQRNVISVLAAFPEPSWPELQTATKRWREDQVDEFEPLLAEKSLADKTTDQLSSLAGTMLTMPSRVDDAKRVLEQALIPDPGSFRLHFQIAAVGFMQLFQQQQAKDAERAAELTSSLLHHMQVCVALRPRSGFVRAIQASALALNQRFPESVRSIEDATRLEPDNAFVWFLTARFWSYTPMPDRGVAACKRAIELDPSLGGVKELLAELESKTEH